MRKISYSKILKGESKEQHLSTILKSCSWYNETSTKYKAPTRDSSLQCLLWLMVGKCLPTLSKIKNCQFLTLAPPHDLFDHVKLPSTSWMSTNPFININSEKLCIGVVKAMLHNSIGKWIMLKSPPSHHGASHHLKTLTNSSQRLLLFLSAFGQLSTFSLFPANR